MTDRGYGQKGLFITIGSNEIEALLDSEPVIAHVTSITDYNIIFCNIFGDLYCLDSNGNEVIDFPDFNPGRGKIAVSGFDHDGLDEIVYYINDELHVFDNMGSEITSFPVSQNIVAETEITVYGNSIYTVSSTGINKTDASGTVEEIMTLNGNCIGEIALADMNNDQNIDLVFTQNNGDVFVCDSNGQIFNGFPFTTGEDCSVQPLLADADNDDQVEVIQMTESGDVYIIENDGTLLNSVPFVTGSDNVKALTITDLDYDGDFDLLYNGESSIYALDFKYDIGSKIPWVHPRGNLSRTGNYSDNKLVPNENNVKEYERTEISNYPNPFNPETTIKLSIKNENLESVKIYNIKGQLVKTLWNEKTNIDELEFIWKGKDNSEKSVGSGVYFYKVKTDKEVYINKMMLLK